MAYRRGFKSEANSTAIEVRQELGLRALDALDPLRLAEHLAIPVIPLSAFQTAIPWAVGYLQTTEPDVFSAATVFEGAHRCIVHNDSHVPGRQASNLAHELAHALLKHEPTPAIDDRGCRLWNQNVEDEAQWLAGALLVTEDAALHVARDQLTVPEAAVALGVSRAMINYRLNVTGARKRVARAQRFHIVR